jgi:hypothetical protein
MARSLLLIALAAALVPAAVAAAQGDASGRLALASDLEIDHEVGGDVLVLGGDLTLRPGARVHGDAVAVLGRVERDPAAVVDGRVLAIGSLATLDLVAGSGSRTARTAAFVLVLGGWLLATGLVGWLAPRRVQEGVRFVRQTGWRVALVGVLAATTFFTGLLAVLGLGPLMGVSLAAVLVVLFIAVKAVGLAVCGATVGSVLVRRLPFALVPTSVDVFVGVALLGTVRMLPFVGGVAWTVLSVVALGAGAFTVVGVAHRVSDEVAVRSS